MFAALKTRLASRTPQRIDEPGVIETAVSVILAPGTRGFDALFMRRAEHPDDPWSGHIGLPGGRREPEDADRLQTALRETREEVGVSLNPALLLGPLDDLHPRTPALPPIVISPYVFGLQQPPPTRLSAEVAAVMWIPLADLQPSECRSLVPIRGEPVEVPCFKLGDTVIWGLTYRILKGLLPLL